MRLHFRFKPLGKRIQPIHFVDEFIAIGRLAIGEISPHHANAVDASTDHACHIVFKHRNVVDNRFHRMFGNQCHTVIGFLPKKSDVVAGGFNGFAWKFIVGGFGFL